MNNPWRKILAPVLLSIALLACSAQPQSPKEADSSSDSLASSKAGQVDLLIKDVTVIDATHGSRSNMDVIVNGSVIDLVAVHQTNKDIEASKTIDGKGKFLIPGLWDAHVHTTFTPELSDSMFGLFVGNGITSVRDTGGQLELVTAWKKKSAEVDGPTAYIAGPLIDGIPTVYDGEQPGFANIARTTTSPEQVIEAVDNLVAAGVDLLKAYEMLSPESFRALIQRAKEHGLPVSGHVPLSMTAVEVAATGINSLEHLRNLEMDCSNQERELFEQRQTMLAQGQDKPGSKLRAEIHSAQHFLAAASLDEERCEILLAALAENNVWQIPTATLMFWSTEPYFIEDSWQQTFDYLPEEVQTKWRAGVARFKESLKKSSTSREQAKEVADWKKQMIGKFIQHRIPIMAGTDTPIFYLTPGYSLHKELETLVSVGMTPLQAIESATLTPAKYFSLEHQQGVVAAGMLADLVLLNRDPLIDIRNTQSINLVIKQGNVIDRAALDKRLGIN